MNFILKNKAKYRELFFSDSFLDQNINLSKNISVIAVVHVIDTGIPYIKTLEKYFSLEFFIPKQKSVDQNLLSFFPENKLLNFTRDQINTKDFLSVLDNLPKKNKIILLDIGGYFSEIGNLIKDRFGDRFIGVIEDTENGHQKYLSKDLNFPVVSVARSLLKENEDHLVGQAVVFSTEAILREQGILLNNKNVGVIGIGKIGNGIISVLKSKSSRVTIFDLNPVNLIICYSKGNSIANKLDIIQNSEVIFCATGKLALKGDDFKYIKNGAFIASVTSSDDEMDLSWVQNNYKSEFIAKYITKYEKNGHYFFILNDGNAVNFIHGAVVDDFILLVQKEMLDTIIEMNTRKLNPGIHEGFEEVKMRIADSWLKNILHLNI